MKISSQRQLRTIVFFVFLFFTNISVFAQNEDKPTILFAPQWKINTTAEYNVDIRQTITQGDFHWNANYSNAQHFTVKTKDDSSYVVLWRAEGIPINIFQDYPGPMYDWFQEWSKGKKLDLTVKFNNLGVPVFVMNPDSVSSFYLTMVDEFIKELPSRDVTPLKKDDVKQSLENLKNLVIPSKTFSTTLLNNLSVLFPFFGKTFYENQDLKLTQYLQLPGINFSVPIEVHTRLTKESGNHYQLISDKSVLPFNQWRIKPPGYSAIDFDYSDTLDFKYDNDIQWVTYSMHSMNYQRGNYTNNFVVTYTKVK